jgi:hypothetical protein
VHSEALASKLCFSSSADEAIEIDLTDAAVKPVREEFEENFFASRLSVATSSWIEIQTEPSVG